MNLQDSYFAEQIENDVTLFAKNKTPKRVLIFPPVDNYRRFIIHQLVQDNFFNLLSTFSIGQGLARRTVVCFKSDQVGVSTNTQNKIDNLNLSMGVNDEPSTSPTSTDNTRQRQAKSVPDMQIYRPPAARKASNISPTPSKAGKQRRPDRAVYVPKGRRSIEEDNTTEDINKCNTIKPNESTNIPLNISKPEKSCDEQTVISTKNDILDSKVDDTCCQALNDPSPMCSNSSPQNSLEINKSVEATISDISKVNNGHYELQKSSDDYDKQLNKCSLDETKVKDSSEVELKDQNSANEKLKKIVVKKNKSDVLIISTDDNVSEKPKVEDDASTVPTKPPDKKVKKMTRTKSKPALPPSPPIKINRDECDWDSLFDDNGECLDPTLIEELTAAVGEVAIEHPKNDYKAYTKTVEVSNDELSHVIEIYNFPADFKTSDLVAAFSPFKSGGFELKWVDDTHCLGVFSSSLVAAEVLASDHPFVKTRPLSEATALSKTKAKKSAEFLQPYRSRPETCAALARRLVTGALGVKLATAQQEREHEKVILREAKERRRLANKQREDAWEGIITTQK
ncbi:coiled-coil domain-containing protein R3HCC1L isoform X2 [Chelonus insularis]|uniref:coiled-coil domain-containing protein R3HCC1L isoform X2 n=1 Tax=Chelonus insularis TaxID=460826 RepID=UPI00158E00A7|nr:coiled-coil domain-containing protein R3HCC1L isoform X2 [Chelonus insularis]